MQISKGALAGLRVIDFGHYVPGPLLGMLFADAGAEVIKIERPGRGSWDSRSDAVLQRGKQRMVLDLGLESELRRALELTASADVFIENFRPGVMERLGLGPDAVRASNDGIVYVRIPGFARDDTRARMQGWESVVSAATSFYRPVVRYPGAPPVSDTPVFTATPVLSAYAAIIAAHSALAALLARKRTGRGAVIDVPLYDVAFEIFGHELLLRHDVSSGGFKRPAIAGVGHYQGSDGEWIQLCLFAEHHLRWFVETFAPSWLDDGLADRERLLADPLLHAELARRLRDLISQRPAAEWETLINEKSKAPAALCQSTKAWLDDDHAIESKAVVDITDPVLGATRQLGQPVVLSGTPLQPRPREALLDNTTLQLPNGMRAGGTCDPGSDDKALPLDGMRIIDFTHVLAGPTAGRILAEYGADVIKIDHTSATEIPWHTWINAGKRSVLLDLKAQDSGVVIDGLFDRADVVLQNFSLGVAERLGVGLERLRRIRPDAVFVSLSAFGPTGRRAHWRGREELGQAITGIQDKWRDADGVPSMYTFPISDISSGHLAAFGTLLALYARRDAQPGQEVATSLAHAATFLQAPIMLSSEPADPEPLPPHGQNATGWGPLNGLYRAADRWFYVVADRLADGLHRVEGLDDVNPQDVEAITERFASANAEVWCERIVAAGGAAHVVVTPAEILDDPVAHKRGLLVKISNDRLTVGALPRLTATHLHSCPPARSPGIDGRSVISEIGLGHLWNTLVESKAIIAPTADPISPL